MVIELPKDNIAANGCDLSMWAFIHISSFLRDEIRKIHGKSKLLLWSTIFVHRDSHFMAQGIADYFCRYTPDWVSVEIRTQTDTDDWALEIAGVKVEILGA